jgi:hypothetical protein
MKKNLSFFELYSIKNQLKQKLVYDFFNKYQESKEYVLYFDIVSNAFYLCKDNSVCYSVILLKRI